MYKYMHDLLHPCQVWSYFWASAQTYDCLCQWVHTIVLISHVIRKSKDYVYGIWAYKALGIWKGYYRVKKSLVSYVKPWTEARNNKYMKYHSKLMSCYLFRSLYILCTACRILAYRLMFFVLHTTRNKAYLILSYLSIGWKTQPFTPTLTNFFHRGH